MKQVRWAALLLAASGAGLACDATGAFGFEFGKPVPADASKDQTGGSVKNAMGCFDGMVPAPTQPFEGYAYCANRDRKFVYAIEASRVYAEGKILDADKPGAAEMYAKARARDRGDQGCLGEEVWPGLQGRERSWHHMGGRVADRAIDHHCLGSEGGG